MSDSPQSSGSVKRFRSPPYPSLDLSKAIDRARLLYNKALHHPVPSNVLADAWKYGIKSSGLWATAAALIQYGLLTDQGSGGARRFTLTDAAMRIIRDADPASEKRAEAIKRAALLPPVFRELWDRYGGSEISDVVITNFLTLDRREAGKAPYSDLAARDIVAAYKATLAFAGISAEDAVSEDHEDTADCDLADASPGPEAAAAEVGPPTVTHPHHTPQLSPTPAKKLEARGGHERELVTGMLSKEATFRLVVSGQVGVKEIDRLIKKLELEKEILGEADEFSEMLG